MTPTAPPTLPLLGTQAGFRRFSVAEYHRLTEIGILTEDDNLELIEGYLVQKMSRNPPHDSLLHELFMFLLPLLPAGWILRGQMAITLPDSEPEPDMALVRTDAAKYRNRHPGPKDFGVIIEVSDSTLAGDRLDKGRIYARAGIPIYWIVNLVDSRVEVYTQPSGPGATPAYARRQNLTSADDLEVVLDGAIVARIAVADLFR